LKSKNDAFDLQLLFHDDLVELYDNELKTSISIDFVKGANAHRQQFGGGRGQAIAKAIGLKSGVTPSVLDATAGLAGDAFVLATLGCSLTLIERSPIISCLLEDAIERASLNNDFQVIIEQGFQLINADANTYLCSTDKRPDVIYIDPMYPDRKKSALVKKDMQILQRLHLQEDDPADLLETAMLIANKRVVVKRPVQAEQLNKRAVSTSIKSKKTRYDVYVISKMS
jgi:16S rRNA (guanine1516-N2)-methyltransferase